MFPSKYLKAADLQDQTVACIIGEMRQEEVGEEQKQKWVLYFKGKEKGLVLNQTNTFAIADTYGEPDNWEGKPVELYTVMTTLNGKPCKGLRVRTPVPDADPDSEVPF